MICRVTFKHARDFARFTVEVEVDAMDDALLAGERILCERIGAEPGQVTGWSFDQAEEVR